jgi:hypothetical protein
VSATVATAGEEDSQGDGENGEREREKKMSQGDGEGGRRDYFMAVPVTRLMRAWA